jgi:hypothetical protein
MRQRHKFILVCEADNLILAGRAAKFLLTRPDYVGDAVLAYGEGTQQVVFYARRNKASITVRQDSA